MQKENNFSITNKTQSRIPSVPFALIKKTVLGNKYDLSLVFVGKKRSLNLNYSYRKKNIPTNVLSFPLDKNIGEIFITPKLAKKDSSIPFLFMHGLLHLKGMRHGSTMEEAEKKLRKRFDV